MKKFIDNNFLKSHSFESYLVKYHDVELAKQKYNEYNEKQRQPFSKIANELFDNITSKIFDKNYKLYYASSENGEKCIYDNELGKLYLVDFFIENNNKIIEFFGDFWHCNPKNHLDANAPLSSHMVSIGFRKVEDIWKRDKNRISQLKKIVGEKNVFVIWEHDYRQDKEAIIQKCIDFIHS